MNPHAAESRLAREVERLYASPAAPAAAGAATVRTLVLEVARPAEWQPLGAVWQGVQAELGLPAPAIAANGVDGLQLWFSLAAPVDAPQAQALLEGLRQRYLPQLPPHRVALGVHASPPALPNAVKPGGPWSAFVAADLAPVFEESPWLDLPPSNEGQAELLSRLASIGPAEFAAALKLLQPRPMECLAPAATAATTPAETPAAHTEAAAFLLRVMQDETAPLALRVEAAKALLPYSFR